jgi:acyl-coenzyme A synthetase/AMP-(fatty) acid ligase
VRTEVCSVPLDSDIDDRLSFTEMIKTNGLQIAPAEIEDLVLQASHEIVECAVVAGPHPTAGEVPVAYIVLRTPSAQKQAIEAAQKFLAEKVARYKIPRTWRIVDALTKTASGKVMRKAMAELEKTRAKL